MSLKKPFKPTYTYTLWNVMMASPTEPMPKTWRTSQLTAMYQGLLAMELDAAPEPDDWRVCSDAINLLETLISQGHMQDFDGLIAEATDAMAIAGKRHLAGQRLGLSGKGMRAVRSCLDSYALALDDLSARVMMGAHRATERRIMEISQGKRRAHDVVVVAL